MPVGSALTVVVVLLVSGVAGVVDRLLDWLFTSTILPLIAVLFFLCGVRLSAA